MQEECHSQNIGQAADKSIIGNLVRFATRVLHVIKRTFAARMRHNYLTSCGTCAAWSMYTSKQSVLVCAAHVFFSLSPYSLDWIHFKVKFGYKINFMTFNFFQTSMY